MCSMMKRTIEIREEGVPEAFTVVRKSWEEGGVRFLSWSFRAERETVFPPVRIHITVPARGIHYRWTPKLHLIKVLNSDWFENLYETSGFTGAPVECLIAQDNRNCAVIALSDTLHTIGMKSIPVEETAQYDVEIALFAREAYRGMEYSVTVRVDTRPLPYYKALADTAKWWETIPGNEPAVVPEAAREIMYSTWYSYHQNVDEKTLFAQAELAKELGCSSLLLDDGWQTEDTGRGYAYCGDWKPAPSKFPDMAGFVKRMHDIGMGVIPWYSVPFIGERSENFQRFKDMLIDPDAEREWHVLDPRYPEVREFLIGIYEKALLDWDLDGFKLDFVDEFVVTPFSGREEDDRRDCTSFTEAADRLMKDCMARLKNHKADIMLEFRQTYNGPRMRSFGNIFRAVDCPFDDAENHVRVTDLRLIAGESAVHSDMLMWDREDTAAGAALQMIQILFSVPQLSMRLEELPREHKEMLAYYCGLWKRYKKAFLEGSFEPLNPQCRYNVIMGRAGEQLACTYHSRELVSVHQPAREMVFVNGTGREGLLLRLGSGKTVYKMTVRECTGEQLSSGLLTDDGGILTVPVPAGGTVELIKNETDFSIHKS